MFFCFDPIFSQPMRGYEELVDKWSPGRWFKSKVSCQKDCAEGQKDPETWSTQTLESNDAAVWKGGPHSTSTRSPGVYPVETWALGRKMNGTGRRKIKLPSYWDLKMRAMLLFLERLLGAKCFTRLPHFVLTRLLGGRCVRILLPFSKWGRWGRERLRNLSMDPQLVSFFHALALSTPHTFLLPCLPSSLIETITSCLLVYQGQMLCPG